MYKASIKLSEVSFLQTVVNICLLVVRRASARQAALSYLVGIHGGGLGVGARIFLTGGGDGSDRALCFLHSTYKHNGF
jgi:hypothetical protein